MSTGRRKFNVNCTVCTHDSTSSGSSSQIIVAAKPLLFNKHKFAHKQHYTNSSKITDADTKNRSQSLTFLDTYILAATSAKSSYCHLVSGNERFKHWSSRFSMMPDTQPRLLNLPVTTFELIYFNFVTSIEKKIGWKEKQINMINLNTMFRFCFHYNKYLTRQRQNF